MHISRIRSLAALTFLLCAVPRTYADNGWDGHIFSFIWENDATAGSDRHYTQGARLSYFSKDDALPRWLNNLSSRLPAVGFDVEAQKFGVAVSQEIYTPEELRSAALVTDDRPYAGWLYGTFTLQRRGRMVRDLPVMEHIRLDLGVIGPESLAEETQASWHGTTPQGWSHQLKTEPGVNLRYDRSVLFELRSRDSSWGGDFIPFIQGSAGNVHSFLGLGSTLRYGYNVPNEFETGHKNEPGKWGAYLFGTAQGRYVFRNIFLDGNTFRDSHSVHKRPLVGDLRAGLTFVLKQVELTAAHTLVSEEFRGQRTLDTYGTATVTIKF
jgi:lipid A 3-O-deacylase